MNMDLLYPVNVVPSQPEFNWFEALHFAIANSNDLSPQFKTHLRQTAGGWPTCACGQLCKELPRARHIYPDGSSEQTEYPADIQLRTLGLNFYDHVSADNWELALNTFIEIETRTNELLIAMDKDQSDDN